ncbi:hypothetical protein Snoj_22330 [Streptomyces nojiriensis]|uniref:Uncharacterized protein n=1 Tax=Streptomyces nojiriensis TaxID=66374 RepID=A0ABQ3SJJ7_9ACTN|nr:hypothetical protein GCM10010205_59110 [Streptomyces nojiriensis]GHI68315.1 hypothetical protein Snoj_22330 [Streptomyces nojiriensis]
MAWRQTAAKSALPPPECPRAPAPRALAPPCPEPRAPSPRSGKGRGARRHPAPVSYRPD